jgi:FKBP-type peptidyl-prolyl cis-trans isomerase FkpA
MKKLLFAVLVIGSLTGCLKSGSSSYTCTYDPCSLKAPATEIQAVKDYLAANNITATQHCSGLFYSVDDPGSGSSPVVCNNIYFSYVGKLTNGNVFDSTSSPIAYNLSQLITGFKNGIPLVKKGGRIHLYIPPTLGYGSTSSSSIPANSILVFDVTLVDFQ